MDVDLHPREGCVDAEKEADCDAFEEWPSRTGAQDYSLSSTSAVRLCPKPSAVHRWPEPRPELRALAAHAGEAERREREAVEEVESLRQAGVAESDIRNWTEAIEAVITCQRSTQTSTVL